MTGGCHNAILSAMRLKRGVRIRGLRTECLAAMCVCAHYVARAGYEFVVTSGSESTEHIRGSLHYSGAAFDFRLVPKVSEVVLHIRGALGEDFDVVVEKDHVHVEYQPKGE